MRLADLLNSGKVTVSTPFRDPYGRVVRKVQVGGDDVGKTLIDAGVAREYDGLGAGVVLICAIGELSRAIRLPARCH